MKEKKEMNVPAVVLSVLGIATLLFAASFVYFSLNGKNYTSTYEQKLQSGEIKNPINEFALDSANFSIGGNKSLIIDEKILGDLNKSIIQESLINYASVILKLYNLHNIPFTSINPKVQVTIDSDSYYVEIVKGNIIIETGQIRNPDAKISTTREEILKIANNNDYATDSISSGETNIELTANKLVLFSKGYWGLYKEFKGKI
ncbi:MAG: hypothetical protein AABX99_00315 [Nanoarchaeota archaeon]